MPAPKEVRPGVADLSTVSEPIGTLLFEHIQDGSQWAKYEWPTEKVAQFWKDGFVANVPLLTEEQCDLILQDTKYLMEDDSHHPGHDMLYEHHSNQTGDPNNILVHALGHWRLTELFHDLVFHPKVIVPASQLLAEGEIKGVRFWHDQFFAKPPKHGGNVAWHQDYSYWTRTDPMMHLTVHIALEDQTEENGCLKYIPGSHRWTRNGGKPLPVLDFNFKDMEGIKTILSPEELEQFKPVSSLLKKGEASFHHPLAVHGSYGNRSDKYRRATVLNYFADGVCSNTDSFMLKDERNLKVNGGALFAGTNIPKGEKMAGQFYPLVFDPAWKK